MCRGQKKRRRGQRSSMGAHERGAGWRSRRDKGRSDQVSMDFSGRMEWREGCVGDRRRRE